MKIHYAIKSTTLKKGYTLGNITFYTAICGYTGDNLIRTRFTWSILNVTCKKCQNIIERERFK